jgi:hypothetical protein
MLVAGQNHLPFVCQISCIGFTLLCVATKWVGDAVRQLTKLSGCDSINISEYNIVSSTCYVSLYLKVLKCLHIFVAYVQIPESEHCSGIPACESVCCKHC